MKKQVRYRVWLITTIKTAMIIWWPFWRRWPTFQTEHLNTPFIASRQTMLCMFSLHYSQLYVSLSITNKAKLHPKGVDKNFPSLWACFESQSSFLMVCILSSVDNLPLRRRCLDPFLLFYQFIFPLDTSLLSILPPVYLAANNIWSNPLSPTSSRFFNPDRSRSLIPESISHCISPNLSHPALQPSFNLSIILNSPPFLISL